MSSYLVYWKPTNINWDDPSSKPIWHSASNQFRKVRSGDRLYFITYHSGGFFLLGRMLVDKVTGQLEAAKYLGCDPDQMWQADYHALAAKNDFMCDVKIPCEDALRKLLVISGGKPQPIKQPFVPTGFQTMRHLTPGSAHLLDDLFAATKAMRRS